MSRRRLAALAGSVALCASGCAAPWDDRSTAEPAPAGGRPETGAAVSPASAGPASGRLRQFRRDLTRRVLQVTVTARAPLHVTEVELDVPGFDALPATLVDSAFPAGATIDLPVAYGAVRCGEPPGPASATLTTVRGGTVQIALEDRGLVGRLHVAQCAEQELAEQVTLSVDPAWTELQRGGRPVLRGAVVLTRQGPGERVVVTELGAHVVLVVRATDLPLVLEPDAPTARLAVDLVASRCDPHALAENKRMTLLSAYVAVGDQPPRLTTLTPDDASRDRLAEFAVRSCRS